MKKLLIIAVLMITANLSAQHYETVLTFKIADEAIQNHIEKYPLSLDKIDRQVPSFDIHLKNIIEIDGHTFDNKISKDPIRLKAGLDGIKIYDSKREYQKRKCDIEKCKVIHLEPKRYEASISNDALFIPNYYRTNTLELTK